MAISLKELKPTVVSKDLKGKFVFIYGPPKIGKTTLAVQFPKNLLFGFEKGYNAIDNIMAVDIPNWAEFKKYIKQLDDNELKEMYNTISIDTIGIAYDKCEAYICNQNDVDKVGDIPYGAGYKMVDKEFEDTLRKITQMGYGMVLIGHEKTRVESDGTRSVTHITPDIPDRCSKIVNRMVDLTAYIGLENDQRFIYPRQLVINEGQQTTDIYAGSHFEYLNNKIELNYDALVDAMVQAMEASSANSGSTIVDKPVEVMKEVKIDLKSTINEIGIIARKLKSLDDAMEDTVEDPHFMSDYKKIVEEYLGKGKLVKEATESQAEHLDLILEDLRAYIQDNDIDI